MPTYEGIIDGKTVRVEAKDDAEAARLFDARKPDQQMAAYSADVLGNDPLRRERALAQNEGRRASSLQAAGLGVQAGALRSFNDEIGANAAAAGWSPYVPPLVSAPVGAIKRAVGSPGAEETYQTQLQRLRGFYEGAQEAHPVAAIGGELVGGAAGPVPGSGIGNAIVRGGIEGAAAGFGAGEGDNRLAGAGVGAGLGAGIGGVAGGVLPAVGRMAQAGYRALLGGVPGQAERLGGEAALRQVGGALREDIGRLTPEQAAQRQAAMQTAQETGQAAEQVIADQGGARTQALLRSAANQSPEGRQAVEQVTGPRFGSQAARTTEWWDRVTGRPNAVEGREALRAQARAENRPAYDRAYNAPDAQSVWTPELQQLTGSPAVQDAIKATTRTSRDYAAIEGGRAPKNPFKETADGALALPENATPTLQFWDHVQRNLRAQTEAAGGVRTEEGSRINQLRTQLNQHLDQTVPAFGEARRGAAAFFGHEDALDAGKDFLRVAPRGSVGEEKAALNRMGPSDRQLFADGVTETVRDIVHGTPDGQDVSKLFSSPELRDRLRLGLGPERSDQLLNYLTVERGMDGLRRALGNSTTARQMAELGLINTGVGAGGAGLGALVGSQYDYSGSGAGIGVATAAILKHGNSRLNAAAAERVARLLVSNNPDDMARVARTMQGNQTIREAVTEGFNTVGRVLRNAAAQQAGTHAGEVIQ